MGDNERLSVARTEICKLNVSIKMITLDEDFHDIVVTCKIPELELDIYFYY